MLRSMREGAKSPIMKAFLIFLAVGFALWGIGDLSGGLLSGGNNAVSAGDRKVTIEEAAYEFERNRRITGRGLTVGEAIQIGLLNEVMGSLARQTLFGAEADRLGVTFTREMQRNAIAQDPLFKDELGQFAEGRFVQSLSSSGFNEESYLEKLGKVLEVNQILGAVIDGGVFSGSTVSQISGFQLEQRQASYVTFTPARQKIVAPTQSELSAWFDERKSQYEAPDTRSFEIIFLSSSRIQNTIIPTEEDIASNFELRRDEFVTPEQRVIRQMVFETEEDAKGALSDIFGGMDFNVVAQQRLGWTEDDVSLGIVRREELTDELAEVAFGAEAGVAFGPVNSAFGFHIAIIDNIEPGRDVTLEDARATIVETLQSEQAIDLVYQHVTRLEDSLGTGASLSEAASQTGTSVIRITDIDRNGMTIDGEAYQSDDAGDLSSDTLFLSEAWDLDIGEISTVVESVDDSFFVIQPTEETPRRARTLDEVRSRAVDDWITEKAFKAALTQATEALASGNEAFSNSTLTEPFRRSGAGLDHSAAGLIASATFSGEQGEAQLVETGGDILIIRTEQILPADQIEIDELAASLTDGFNELVRNDIASAMALSLSETHKLEVNSAPVQKALVGSLGQ